MTAMTAAYERAQAAQRDAANPAQSVFVTANAGSGKTKVLVDRIARLLLSGAKPSAFLCITFTKAAASEMQRRLFDRLGRWCVMEDDALRAQFADLGEPEPDAARLAEARALFARALETPGGLRIQTIHGFCERLLGRFPLEARVPPGFAIADEPRSAALIAAAWASAAREESLSGVIARLGRRFDAQTFDLLLAALAGARTAIGDHVRRHGGADAAQAAIAMRHGAVETPEAIAVAAMARVDWALLRRLAEVLAGSERPTDRDRAESLTAVCASPSFDELVDIFVKENGEPAALCTAGIRKANGALVAACEDLQRTLVEAHARRNAAARAAEAAAALAIGEALARGYDEAKQAAGILDFEDLIEKAIALLSDSAAAPWVLYKLDGGLSHILIDEGQDTSPAQWRLIAPLQAEFFAGEGARANDRTVFAVGDPKQSIFSFQGADPEHFMRESRELERRAREAGRPYSGPTLAMSFRSAPEVLKAVDDTLAGLDLASGPESGEVVKHDARRAGETGRVEWWPLAPPPEARSAVPWDAPVDNDTQTTAIATLCRTLAERVRDWIDGSEGVWEEGRLRPMRPGDVLALVRARGALFTQLLRAFKRAGLPVAGADRMVLADEIVVQDLLCAARVALNPADDLSLATLLKSPWIGLLDDDNDIFPLAHGRDNGERVIARLNAAPDPRYAQARAFVADLQAQAGAHPHAFFSRILDRLTPDGVSGWEQMLARLGREARDPAEELLARALTVSRQGPATLQHFIAAIEGDASQIKRETEQKADAVRVMTVHGAKGLEAPVVLLADTTGAVEWRSRSNFYMTGDGPVVGAPKGGDDAVTRKTTDDVKAAAKREHDRLLYVAMTRARDRLIVCGHQRGAVKEGAENCWWQAVRKGLEKAGAEEFDAPFGKGLALGETFKAPATSMPPELKTTLPVWIRAPAPDGGATPGALSPSHLGDGPVLSPRAAARARFRRGTLIHGLLQRLPDVAPDRRDAAARAWLAARGVRDPEAEALIAESLRVLDDARFAAVFGPGSRAEAPVVATLADGVVVRGAVDRLLVTEREIFVIDFKTDRPPPARPEETPPRILAQMAAYRAALAMIFPRRPVRAALLWTDGPDLMGVPDALLDGVRPLDARC